MWEKCHQLVCFEHPKGAQERSQDPPQIELLAIGMTLWAPKGVPGKDLGRPFGQWGGAWLLLQAPIGRPKIWPND